MKYPEFLQIRGTRRAGTLTTLTERLSRGQARDLLQQLPAPIKPWLNTDRNAERSDVDEFLRRVAEREGVDIEPAERHARVFFFFALGRAVSDDEIADVADELLQDFEPLVAEAQRRFFEIMPAEEFRGQGGGPASAAVRPVVPLSRSWRRSPSVSPGARSTT